MESENTIKAKFKKLWKHYILQSLLAAVSVFILILIFGKDKMVVISAMGATSFIVFAMPNAISAKRRHVIGGHLIGLACGAVFYLMPIPHFIEYSLAVGVAIFFMVALDFEHPPAVGTALAVVINEISFDDSFAIILSAIILSQCCHYLRHYLKDLV